MTHAHRPKTTLEQWRILQAVVDCGGYAKAAEYLNKSQSSLNHAVAKLQSLLDVQLLVVQGRKAQLTPAGVVMLRRSRDLTDNVEALESLALNINAKWEPEVSIAIDLAFDKGLIYPALQAFLPESRGSRLTILDTVLTGTDDAITTHAVDLAIAHQIPTGYLGEPIANINLIAVCHPNHPICNIPSPIDPVALSRHLQIVIKDTSATPNETSGWLKSENRWTVSHFDTALALLAQNIGFCWVPAHLAQPLVDANSLQTLNINGCTHKHLTSFLIIPQPDNIGPSTRLLAELILANRRIHLPLNTQD